MDQVIRPNYRFYVDRTSLLAVAGEDILSDILLGAVSNFLRVPIERMRKKSRKREIVLARNVATVMLYRYTHLSLKAISLKLGGKEHTRTMHSLDTIVDYMDTDDPVVVPLVKPLLQRFDQLYPVCRRRSLSRKHDL